MRLDKLDTHLAQIDKSIKNRLNKLEVSNAQVKSYLDQLVPTDVNVLLNDARKGQDTSVISTQ